MYALELCTSAEVIMMMNAFTRNNHKSLLKDGIKMAQIYIANMDGNKRRGRHRRTYLGQIRNVFKKNPVKS